MGGMRMPGGWTMSIAWMRMPGQTWIGAAAAFLAMWVVMMVAMMLPSLIPILRRYREAVSAKSEPRLGWLTVLVGASYFFVWTVFGMIAFPMGIGLAQTEMQQPALAHAMPIAAGVVVLLGAHFNSPHASRVILPAVWICLCLATNCRPMPQQLGDMASALDCTAAFAVLV